jgi:hypothetical protein
MVAGRPRGQLYRGDAMTYMTPAVDPVVADLLKPRVESHMSIRIVLVAAFVLIVLGGCGEPCPYEPQFWTDLGIGVYVEDGTPPFAHSALLSHAIDRAARAVADYGQVKAANLSGWTVVLRSSWYVECNGGSTAIGCSHSNGWIDVGTAVFQRCVDETALPHEFLHALGFHGHSSPLWSDWGEVINQLERGPESQEPCHVFAELWVARS